ncbi:MAG TPA: hypothetical protein VFJ73_02370 [Bacillales bacterium]|nr:hypothetical protein [Bacillales bacterium]
MRIRKRPVLVLLVAVVFSATFVSWAYGKTLSLQISVAPGSDLPGGEPAIITAISGTAHTVKHNGTIHKLAGIPLYKVELARDRYSELVQIYITAIDENGEQISRENWVIEVNVFYPAPAGTTPDRIIKVDGVGEVAVNRLSNGSDGADLTLNRTKAGGIILPGRVIPGNTTLYVVATYKNHGGQSPKGQQNQLNRLTFHCMIRM